MDIHRMETPEKNGMMEPDGILKILNIDNTNFVNRFLKFFKITYRRIVQSIAFYPVLISGGFFIFSFVVFSIENIEIVQKFKENVPYLIIQNTETARTILAALIGGILSLTVFSFSMVMVVLSQASANFSPRLLPGLISNKKHQIILGFYIGTLLYCIATLIFLGAYGISSEAMGISVTIGAILGVFCVGLFAYFIHNISEAIQINRITSGIYRGSKHFFKEVEEVQREHGITSANVNTDGWQLIESSETGYFRGFHASYLPEDFCKTENQIEVLPYIGQHIWKGDIIIKVKNHLDEGQKKCLSFATTFSDDRLDSNEATSGLIKLMEVTVKAMSPGINDPGTATDAIIKVIKLLRQALQLSPQTIQKDENLIIVKNTFSAKEIMRLIIEPIRYYSRHDCTVMYTLITGLQQLSKDAQISEKNRLAVTNELEAISIHIEKNISNPIDRERLLLVLNT